MKPTVIVFDPRLHESLMLKFLLVRADVEATTFHSEYELENWLGQCVGDASVILGAIVDSASCPGDNDGFAFTPLLISKKIPLIVTAVGHPDFSGQKLMMDFQAGLPVYHILLHHLPQLLMQMRGRKEQ